MKIEKKLLTLLICALIGAALWFTPPPQGVTLKAWHLLSLFIFTILGIITKPLPMGAMALLGLTLTIATGVMSFEEGFAGFHNDVVWLIVIAFFIARGIISTGLGSRVAYHIMGWLGKSSLGLGYGMAATDLVLAPFIPSTTARAGGVIFPMMTSLAKAFSSEPHNGPRKIGAYLTQTAFQGTCITSAMFLTAMAGNPLIAEMVSKNGVHITWSNWALAAFVPGIISLLIMPYILYKIYPPEIKETPTVKTLAKKKLKEMGKLSGKEKMMIGVFFLLIILWIAGPAYGIKAASAALIGLVILLITRVLSWSELLKEDGAWDTLIWFAVLVMMAGGLNKYGLTGWFSEFVVTYVQGWSWIAGFGLLSIIYFYSHYFFASNVAHIGSMYPPFFLVALALGTPPLLAALILGFFSSLFGGITHYGCGPAPLLFGSGYVKITEWWKFGFITSVINIVIWLGVGAIWWKFLGLF